MLRCLAKVSPVSQTGPTMSKGHLIHTGRGFDHRDDIVPRAIHRGTDQVVHRRVEDQEIAPLALLDVDDAGHQQPRIAGDQAPGLDLDLDVQIADGAADDLAVFQRQGRRGVRPFVGNAEPAAEVEPADVVTVGAQLPVSSATLV
jgi:hypothetical protein